MRHRGVEVAEDGVERRIDEVGIVIDKDEPLLMWHCTVC